MKVAIDYSENLHLLKLAKTGDTKARQQLIIANLPLVKSIARRFCDRGYELEDLIETGNIGLIKAIDGFDETLGNAFSTYAFSFITGEIKRFLRDDGIIKISRKTKKNAFIVMKAKELYIKEHGKEPKISELCNLCGLSQEEISSALEASVPILSIFEKIGDGENDFTVLDFACAEDSIGKLTDKIALNQALDKLSEFDRKLITLRYFKNLTQTETAKLLCVTQVSVSRTEKKIIEKLKSMLYP